MVRAVSNTDELSDASNALSITTDRDDNGGDGGGEVTPGRQWDSRKLIRTGFLYKACEEVVHNGVTYITWQLSILNYGDTNWAPGIAHAFILS